MSKRPRGLKAAAAIKAASSAGADDSQDKSGPSKRLKLQAAQSEVQEVTVTIQSANGGDANAHKEGSLLGDLTDLRYLYDQFGSGKESSVSLARGMVHECDRILRKSDRSIENSQDLDDKDWTLHLPWSFHYIYAWALYRLALTEEGNDMKASSTDAIEFQLAALERAERGLVLLQSREADSNTAVEDALAIDPWRLYTLKAEISFSLAPRKQIKGSETLESMFTSSLNELRLGLQANEPHDDSKEECIKELCNISELLRSYDDGPWASKYNWTFVALEILVIASSIVAMPLVQRVYDEFEKDENYDGDLITSAQKELGKAIHYLEVAYQSTQKCNHEEEMVAMYAEALANRGNMERDDDSVQQSYWKKAIKVVDEAIEQGTELPDDLVDMISELKEGV